jgi:plasmid stabilization system protein ParE
MKYRIVLKNQAERDLRQTATYLLECRGEDSAIRFLEAAETSFDRLAQMPAIGKSCQLGHPRLKDVRQWRVKAFKDYLIFYRITDFRIEVLRVVNGAMDLQSIFDQMVTEDDGETL